MSHTIVFKYNKEIQYINNGNKIEKLNIILNPPTPEDIKTVVSFIQRSLELRKGDIHIVIQYILFIVFLFVCNLLIVFNPI